jgi:hypothetical protein
VIFRGLTADSFILRTEEQDFRATINGIQIVAAPEPATAIGIVIFGLVTFALRWRNVK